MAAPNWHNRTLFHGDNLGFLRAMNSESVDLIATDPPFNKGRDFHATPDSLAAGASFQDRWSWERDVHPDWLDRIKNDWPAVWEVIDAANAVYMRKTKKNLKQPRDEVGSDMGAFLCFMAVRLIEMHRILRSTGTIYLHCDHTASHYLKAVMDAIFGPREANYRNEIIWCYRGGGVPKRDFARKHDTILRYSKTKTVTFNVDDVRIPYSQDVLDSDPSRYDKSYRSNKTYEGYRPNELGKHPEDWWPMQPLMPSDKTERTGFLTQKPIALYERIIKASSDRGGIVLDPFAGCATTLVTAELLGRQWVGIDIWDKAHQTVLKRLQDRGLSIGDAKTDKVMTFGKVHYVTELPERTDDGETAAPPLRVKKRIQEPPGPKMTRAEMYLFLLDQDGQKCRGCDRSFDDPRYLELDHNLPRSDGGPNHISNRILLCGPCNKLKSNIYTLSGLRRENKKRGYMR